MQVPPGYTEEQVVSTINRIAKLIARKFVFGSHTVEDITQQCWIIALEVLAKPGKYDASRPLDRFLYVHLVRRIGNYKRDHFHRSDPPCRRCNEGDFCRDGGPCKKFREWKKLNSSKANLQMPADIDRIADEDGSVTGTKQNQQVDAVEGDELRLLIDDHLPCELRAHYLAMLAGDPLISTAQKREVRRAIIRVVHNFGDPESLGLPGRDDKEEIEWFVRGANSRINKQQARPSVGSERRAERAA
jgi:hypothetical protein